MNKFFEIIIKYLGIPLLQKLGEWVMAIIHDYAEKRRIIKEQKEKEKEIEDAKTPEDIRTAHRNNRL